MLEIKYNNNDIVAFKLSTGEEVLARLVEEKDNDFVVSKPMSLIPQGDGLVLNQSIFSVDVQTQSVKINKNAVVMHARARKELVDNYTQATSSIQTVPSSSTGQFQL